MREPSALTRHHPDKHVGGALKVTDAHRSEGRILGTSTNVRTQGPFQGRKPVSADLTVTWQQEQLNVSVSSSGCISRPRSCVRISAVRSQESASSTTPQSGPGVTQSLKATGRPVRRGEGRRKGHQHCPTSWLSLSPGAGSWLDSRVLWDIPVPFPAGGGCQGPRTPSHTQRPPQKVGWFSGAVLTKHQSKRT